MHQKLSITTQQRVYHLGDNKLEYVGCDEDTRDDRLLGSIDAELTLTNAPNECVDICLTSGEIFICLVNHLINYLDLSVYTRHVRTCTTSFLHQHCTCDAYDDSDKKNDVTILTCC